MESRCFAMGLLGEEGETLGGCAPPFGDGPLYRTGLAWTAADVEGALVRSYDEDDMGCIHCGKGEEDRISAALSGGC